MTAYRFVWRGLQGTRVYIIDEWTSLNNFLLDQQCIAICGFAFPMGFLPFTSFVDNCKIRKRHVYIAKG